MAEFSFITGPVQAHGVKSPAEYEALQRDVLRRAVASGRSVGPVDPFPVSPAAVPYINAGKWKVKCACGNAPSASPAWRVARCLECGAVHADLSFPDDRDAIEAALMQRPNRMTRNWKPGTTLAGLVLENAAAQEAI